MIQHAFQRNKKAIILTLILFGLLCGWWLSYNLFGHQLIKAMYEGRSAAFLNGLIKNQSTYSIEHYTNKADHLVFKINYSSAFFFIASLIFFFLLS